MTTSTKVAQDQRTHEFQAPSDEELAQAAKICKEMIDQGVANEKSKIDALWKDIHEWAERNDVRHTARKDPYTQHEWLELPFITEYLRRRLISIPVKVIRDEDKTISKLMEKNLNPVRNPPIPFRMLADHRQPQQPFLRRWALEPRFIQKRVGKPRRGCRRTTTLLVRSRPCAAGYEFVV